MRGILISLALASFAMAAHANPVGADGVSLNEVRQVMRNMGLAPTDSPQNDNEPGLAASFGGVNYDVALHECDARGNCLSIQAYAGFTLTTPIALERINSWNQEWRFAYASVDAEGAPFVQIDQEMKYGSTEQIEAMLERFHDLAPRFAEYIGFTSAAAARK